MSATPSLHIKFEPPIALHAMPPIGPFTALVAAIVFGLAVFMAARAEEMRILAETV